MDNKDLQDIHDEIWSQIYDRQKRPIEQKSESTHSDNNSQPTPLPEGALFEESADKAP
jgi:hypothetical protein